MYRESHVRSVAKTVSWRITATITTTLLVLFFTRKIEVALAVGGMEVVLKMLLYFFHERIWDRVKFGKRQLNPAVLWFTGLSGSGKSTLAQAVQEKLLKKGLKVEYLDGDNVRDIFPKTGFSKEERDAHVRRVGYLASRLAKNGVFVAASFISPYEESREFVRSLCSNFTEIYVSTPLEECERRDVKGLYAKVRSGEIKNFTGVDDPYEAPSKPELEINTQNMSIDEAADEVISYLEERVLKSKGKVIKNGFVRAVRKQKRSYSERGLQSV